MEYYATYLNKDSNIYRYCKYCIDNDFTHIDISVLKEIVKIINNCGFDIDVDYTKDSLATVEVFNRTIDDDKYTEFPPHQEKEQYPNTFTFCCYVKNTCQGGQLGFYEINDDEPSILVSTKDTKTMARIVFFNDEIMHTGMPFSNGIRQLVSIHINK